MMRAQSDAVKPPYRLVVTQFEQGGHNDNPCDRRVTVQRGFCACDADRRFAAEDQKKTPVVERATTVKSSKSNTSDRTTTVKGSKSNSSDRKGSLNSSRSN